MDEFLPEELKKLRNYVLKARDEDISSELHVFEGKPGSSGICLS